VSDKDNEINDLLKAVLGEGFEDMFQTAALLAEAKEKAEARRAEIREEVKARIEGRTFDEIAEEALFEALVSQEAVIAQNEALIAIREAVDANNRWLHDHIHKSDVRATRHMAVFITQVAARLTGEPDLTSEESNAFFESMADKAEAEGWDADESDIKAADAFVEYLRARREGESRFQA
jgi:hypothetical protein